MVPYAGTVRTLYFVRLPYLRYHHQVFKQKNYETWNEEETELFLPMWPNSLNLESLYRTLEG
jgi:hypothetical protein